MSLRSVLIVPVVVDGRLQAIVEVVSSKPHAFNAQHRHELSRMAQGIAALLTDATAKRPPKSETKEHRASSTIAAPTVKRVEAASHPPEARTLSDLGEGPQQESAVVARDVPKPVGSRILDLSAVLRSLSATTKAGIGVALVAVLALGWYIGGGVHRPAGSASAPATKADTTPLPTSAQRTAPDAAPEITVEQNSLSVFGREGSPKATGSAPQLTPGQLVRKVQPAYPGSALAGGIGGTVVLTALVTKQGSVTNVRFVRGPEALAAPAIDAVRQWVYEPYRLGGEPVAVETMIVIRFTPHKQP
jgi:TonB family protein